MSESRLIDSPEKENLTAQSDYNPASRIPVEQPKERTSLVVVFNKEDNMSSEKPEIINPISESGEAQSSSKQETIDNDQMHGNEQEPVIEQEQASIPEDVAPRKKELSNKEITDQTASLWKYLPVPNGEPDPMPEYLVSSTRYSGARIVGARVRGKKHKHEGSNCDDWFETTCYEDVIFAAVSDGAGSKKFSRIGASTSCKAAVGFLVNEYPKLIASLPSLREDLMLPLSEQRCVTACGQVAILVQQAVLQAREAVKSAFYLRSADPAYEEVLHRKLTLEDLSGTLLVSVIIPIKRESKEHLIVTCQIGDGMTAAINKKGTFQSFLKLLGIPDSGEFTGETEFLTSKKMTNVEELQKRTKVSLGPVDTVLMMSDGVADDYFPNETQMRRLYFDLIANGILHTDSEKKSLSDLSSDQMRIFKKIPDPISYPWVNDKSVIVPVQYTNRICESMNLSLEELWESQDILTLASLEVREKGTETNDAEKLKQWLDNYYERGSFDDRTLVVIEL